MSNQIRLTHGSETFDVFVRLGGIIKLTVDARDPEAAREAARNMILRDPDGYVPMLRCKDLTTVVPICYERDDGAVARDYGPTPEERAAMQNEADGHKLWVLMRLERDSCGHVEAKESKLFVSLSDAQEQMAREYSDRYDRLPECEPNFYQTPFDGEVRCYLELHDTASVEWFVVETKLCAVQLTIGENMTNEKMTEERLGEILPGWKVCVSGDCVELTRRSPAGEEVCVGLTLGTAEDMAKRASEYYDDFDPDDHAAQIYHAKHYGPDDQKMFYAGAPDSLEDLMADAHAIDNMYYGVYAALRNAAQLGTRSHFFVPPAEWKSEPECCSCNRFDFDAMFNAMMFGRGHAAIPVRKMDQVPFEKRHSLSQEELEALPYRTLIRIGPPAVCSDTFADAISYVRRYLIRNLGEEACLADEDGCTDDAELERRVDSIGRIALYVKWPDEDKVVLKDGAFAAIFRLKTCTTSSARR